LDYFEPGNRYDVGTALGCLFLSEGWAEPVVTEEPALLKPLRQTAPDTPTERARKAFREERVAVAADRNRRNRR
jgi:hypothetical protein